MSLSESVETMITAAGETDWAAGEVELLRRLAMLLDENPFSEPEIYREYRFALKAVKEALGGDSDVDEELSDLLARLGRTDVQQPADAG